MRNSYDTTSAQGTKKRICAYCGRQWYAALVRTCPERDRPICAYCCRHCRRSYRYGSAWGCRAADQKRAEQARKKAG